MRHPLRYLRSLYGIVDVLSVLPAYLTLLVQGAHSLLVIRIMRMLTDTSVLIRPRGVSRTTRTL